MVVNFRRLRLFLIILLILFGIVYFLQAKWFWQASYPWPYKQEMVEVGASYGVDPFLLAAVAKVESGFNPDARSDAGAVGLMQVMPSTADWAAEQMGYDGFHADLLYQPDVNLLIGGWYLSNLLEEFDGDVVTALAAYNAGRGNVSAWLESERWEGTMHDLESIPFPETRDYLRSVLRNYEIYQYLYE
ncbi:MAG TPA: transglycosylase [Peptococcaceae bacterium]|nr:transglycosylase [Peptococcaceae bacterium]